MQHASEKEGSKEEASVHSQGKGNGPSVEREDFALWSNVSIEACDVQRMLKEEASIEGIQKKFKKYTEDISLQFKFVECVADQVIESTTMKSLLSFAYSGRETKKGYQQNTSDASSFEESCLSNLVQANPADGTLKTEECLSRYLATKLQEELLQMKELVEDCNVASKVNLSELEKYVQDIQKSVEAIRSKLREVKRNELVTPQSQELTDTYARSIKQLEHLLTFVSIRWSKLEVDRDLTLAACKKVSVLCRMCKNPSSTLCLGEISQLVRHLLDASAEHKILPENLAGRRKLRHSAQDIDGYRVELYHAENASKEKHCKLKRAAQDVSGICVNNVHQANIEPTAGRSQFNPST